MSDKIVPIALMAFIRPDLLQRVMDQLALMAPPLLYVIGDGPRNEEEKVLCSKSREIALNPSWDCEVVPFLCDNNKGVVDRFTKGLDYVFSYHDRVIYLEDDILLSPSFYDFATETLEHYKDDLRVGHVNSTNFASSYTRNFRASYLFSKHPMIWGFATWKRMWETYDVSMPKWAEVDQANMLRRNCFNRRERRSTKEMFDLHCGNVDPWTCDYQWSFNCMYRNAFSITPVKNLSLNIGFAREDSTHTKHNNPFANELEDLALPLSHPPEIKHNLKFDNKISAILSPSKTSIFMGKVRSKIDRIFHADNL